MRASCLVFLILGMLVASCRTNEGKREDLAPLGSLPWSSFEWDAWPGVTEKGAMIVPITIGGKRYEFQLDTGADAMIVYGNEAERFGWQPGQRSVRVQDIRLGGANLEATDLYVMPELQPKLGESQGTVGLGPLLGKLVILDYPGKRFCVVSRSAIPAETLERMPAAPAEIRNGKLFVEVKLGGKAVEDVFFDTGASVFPMLVDFAERKVLTGLATERDATTSIMGSSWGKPTPFVGGRARGALEVGAYRVTASRLMC